MGPAAQVQAPKYKQFKIENITVTRAPLLKVYYWEYFDIDGLNEKLQTAGSTIEHSITMPTCQINSKPLKIVWWFRNCSVDPIDLRLKRIRNCACKPLQTRVGFNQFRHLYHCPHRRLIHILQENMHMKPDDLVAMSIVTHFFLFGEHQLTYEMRISNERLLILHFQLDIIGFDPQKCILTKELIPTDLREFRRFVQPIWVRNITVQHTNFVFSSRDRGFKLINPNMTVPRQSVWPLMVEYRPSDLENTLELMLNYEAARTKFPVTARGVIDTEIPQCNVPIEDYDCADFLYVIYPNRLEFNVQPHEERSQLVAIHNHNQKCLEFHWQSYVINDLFEISFVPEKFRLKPHHCRLCMVKLIAHERPLQFKRIPMVLEVHRIFDKATKLAKSLLEEVESIDDPKWKQDSYMEHVFLHMNLKVNFKKLEDITTTAPICNPSGNGDTIPANRKTTIFEKLFWEYLQKSKYFMRVKDAELDDELNYEEVLELYKKTLPSRTSLAVTKNSIIGTISDLLFECLQDVSKNWRFIPREITEQAI